MNTLGELRARLLGAPAQQSGTIIEAITATSFRVRTAQGVVECNSADGNAYHVDDEVLVRGNIIQGRLKNIATVPVYNV